MRIDGEIDPDHPLAELLDTGNSLLTGVALRRLTAQHLELAGEAFWLKDRGADGAPAAFYPLPPTWVLDLPGGADGAYRIALPAGRQVLVPAADIVCFRDPDPRNPYGRGLGTAGALADELALDEATARFLAAFFENHARPDLIVTGTREAPLSEDGARRLAEVWDGRHRGAARAHRPFFTSGALDIHELGGSFQTQHLVDLRRFSRDAVVQAYGLPPEKLGILAASNRATIEASDLIFAKDVLLPRLELMRAALQRDLEADWPGVEIGYDSPVAADRAFQLQVMTAAPDLFSPEEWRALAGIEGPAPEVLEPDDERAFNSGQPRKPRGPGGGQWVVGPGGAGADTPVVIPTVGGGSGRGRGPQPARPTSPPSTQNPAPAKPADPAPAKPADSAPQQPRPKNAFEEITDHAYGLYADGIKHHAYREHIGEFRPMRNPDAFRNYAILVTQPPGTAAIFPPDGTWLLLNDGDDYSILACSPEMARQIDARPWEEIYDAFKHYAHDIGSYNDRWPGRAALFSTLCHDHLPSAALRLDPARFCRAGSGSSG